MIQLRPYQEDAVKAGVRYFQSPKNKRGLIVAPTAAGKSYIIAEIARLIDRNVLVLQPSVELLKQNVAKIKMAGITPAIFSASAGQKRVGKITYATIGSVIPHASLFRGYVCIVDEAHMYPARDDSMFGALRDKAGINIILGLTATPFRLTSEGNQWHGSQLTMLNKTNPRTYNDFLHVIQVQDIIRQGFWSKLKYEEGTGYNRRTLQANSSRSDYTAASMTKAWKMYKQEIEVGRKIMELKERGRKKILVFVPTIAECYSLQRHIPGAGVVHGANKAHKITMAQRARAIGSFTHGDTSVMINVDVLSVGFDFHGIDAVVMARPTMSLAWYYQAVGRGTRLDPTGFKRDCLIVDFVGNVELFGRIEDIVIEKDMIQGWGAYGSAGRILTGIPLENCGQVVARHRRI